MSLEEDMQRLNAAQHAMMTGVGYKASYDSSECDLKQIRVGINTALVNCGVIAGLLIEKGILTQEEYYSKLADAMEKEKDTYQEWLNKYFKKKYGKSTTEIILK